MFKKIKIFIIFFLMAASLSSPILSLAATVSYPTAVKDGDYDGLTDQGETQVYKTDPQNADSDGDGYLDGAEVLAGTDPLVPEIVATPLNPISETAGENTVSFWPWYFARASGIAAYILLFLLIVTGGGIKTSWSFRFISPTIAWLNHRYLGIALTFSVIVHLVSLLVDKYLKFTIIDILVPFVSTYKPIFLSLGIIGFYMLIAVIITSIFSINKFPKAWRLIHYLTYPMFIILFIHGYFTGTDTPYILIQLMYLITGIIFSLFCLYRLYFFYKQQ